MKLATFNANSVRTRMPVIINWLQKENPDVLCLQETKVQDKDFPAGPFEKAGYHISHRGQKSYNGVAIASRESTTQVRYDLYEQGDEQARFISAVISNISIINVYVPQGFAVDSEKFEFKLLWLRDLFSFIKERYNPGDPLIISGDFNIALTPGDVYDPETLEGEVGFHPLERALMREILDWGLIDIFRKHHREDGHYTFWDYRIPNALKRKMGWRIDYILATKSLAEESLGSRIDTDPRSGPKPSDHTFLIAEFK